MRLISWNVNGIRAAAGKGFAETIAALSPDILCLQETKINDCSMANLLPYHSYWCHAEKKGYSGTAVFTKDEPLNVTYGIGIEKHDHEGRVITVETTAFTLVNVYTPNAQEGLKRLDYRMEWDEVFADYVCRLDESKPVIICGDMNVAHEEIDLKNPKANRRNPGFTDEERGTFSALLDRDFRDTFRTLHPTEEKYSWWSYRFQARQKNIGWRIDYFLVSTRWMDNIISADIHTTIMGSDHCPVEIITK